MSALRGRDEPPPLPPAEAVLGLGKPFPPASMAIRGIAYGMDCLLVLLLGGWVVIQVIWASEFPGAFDAFREIQKQGGGFSAMAADEELVAAINQAQNFFVVFFTLYFGLAEIFFGGATLGKKTFRIRTISLITLERPPAFTCLFRGLLKAVAFLYFPLLILDLAAKLFNPERRLVGHDWLARTFVLDERYAHPDVVADLEDEG